MNTCTCGSEAPSGSPVYSPSTSFVCPGNSDQSCGAPGFGIIYRLPRAGEGGSTEPDVSTDANGQVTTLSSINQSPSSVPNTNPISIVTTPTPGGPPTTIATTPTGLPGSPPVSSNTGEGAGGSQGAGGSSTNTGPPILPSDLPSVSPSVPPPPGPDPNALSSANGTSSSVGGGGGGIGASSSPAAASSSNSPPAGSTSNPPTGGAQSTSNGNPSPNTSNGGGGGPLISATASYAPILTQAACPGDDYSQETDPLGVPYNVNCDLQLRGDNLQPLHADNLDACLQNCDMVKGCAGTTYVDATNDEQTNENCFPYSKVTGLSDQDLVKDLYAAVAVEGPNNATEYQENLCTDPNYGDGSTYTNVYADTFDISCGKTLTVGVQLAPLASDSLLGCLSYCSLYPGCVAVVFFGDGPPPPNTRNCYPYKTFVAASIQTNSTASIAILDTGT